MIGELHRLLPDLDKEKRADVLLEIMAYLYPKRKAIEKLELTASLHSLDGVDPKELRQFRDAIDGELKKVDPIEPKQFAAGMAREYRMLADTSDDDEARKAYEVLAQKYENGGIDSF